jgi:2-keto-4-pentenoate hydratase
MPALFLPGDIAPHDLQLAQSMHRALATGSSHKIRNLIDNPLSLAEAYRIGAQVMHLRKTDGDSVSGWKVGFTNRTIWDQYQVHAPIVGPMYARSILRFADPSSLHCPLEHIHEPRIEPEIVFEMRSSPHQEMDERELLNCVSAIGHGFEIVTSPYAAWKFSAVDTLVAAALHARMVLGPLLAVEKVPLSEWAQALSEFSIDLFCDKKIIDTGEAHDVLDGPLNVLRHLAGVLNDPEAGAAYARGIEPGDLITTGTVTRAFPVAANQQWETRIQGLPFAGISLRLS